MTNYVKTTSFTPKDSLASGNAAKRIKGSEFDTEFDNIATAISSKANSADILSSAVVLLDSQAVSAVSQVDVETGFSSTYDNYLIVADDVRLSVADSIVARWKVGGSYISTSTYISVASGGSSGTTATSLTLLASTCDTAIDFDYRISGVNQTSRAKTANVRASGVTIGTPTLTSGDYAHFNSGTGAITGVRFYCSGGATITGNFRIYGIAKS